MTVWQWIEPGAPGCEAHRPLPPRPCGPAQPVPPPGPAPSTPTLPANRRAISPSPLSPGQSGASGDLGTPLPFSPLPAAGPPGFSGDATPRAEHTDEAPPPAP
eukprot:12934380-Alexandrium_andersonii.AAC.1